MKTITDDPITITCMSNSKHFPKMRKCCALYINYVYKFIYDNILLLYAIFVCLIENNVNSSPAMLAKWHSHTNSNHKKRA